MGLELYCNLYSLTVDPEVSLAHITCRAETLGLKAYLTILKSAKSKGFGFMPFNLAKERTIY